MQQYFYLIFIPFVLFFTACNNDKNNANHPAYNNASIKPYTETIQANPKDAQNYYKRSVALAAINMDSLALVDIEKAITLDPDNINYLKAKGNLLLLLDKAAAAIPVFQNCMEKQPEELSYKLYLSNALLLDNQAEKAEKTVQEVLTKDDLYPDAYYWYAQIKAFQKDTAAAINMLHKAIYLDSMYYDAALLLGDYYAMQGNQKAIPQYLKTFYIDTLEALPLFQIGYFFEKQLQLEKAKIAYADCILHDPDFTDAYIQTGKILLQQDSIDKAKRILSIAVKTEPNNDEAHYHLGIAYEKLGFADSASIAYTNAISFNSYHEEAKTKLKSILEKNKKE